MQQQPLDINTLERLRATDAWKQIEREDEAAIEAEHARAAGALDKATADRDRELPPIDAKLSAAQADIEKKREALKCAEAAHFKLFQEKQNIVATHRAATREAEQVLRSTAPDEIRETRSLLDRTTQAARGNFQHVDLLQTPQYASDPKPLKERSNGNAVDTLMAACISGIRRCDELTTAPMTRAEIREELARIRASIPRFESTAFDFELDVVGKAPMFERVTGR